VLLKVAVTLRVRGRPQASASALGVFVLLASWHIQQWDKIAHKNHLRMNSVLPKDNQRRFSRLGREL